MSAGEWRSIETAPKDGARILLYRSERIVCGRWNPCLNYLRPKPYWSHDQEQVLGGTIVARKIAPTHWMPLPPPPREEPAGEAGERGRG